MLASAERADRSHVLWGDIFATIDPATLNDLAALAKDICKAPIALVTLVDGDRYWCTSVIGASEIPAIPWEQTFCAYAVRERGVFVVADAEHDQRFVDHPLVCAPPGVRFYAGAPFWADDRAIGTLCVMDSEARALSPAAEASLAALARQTVAQLELLRHRAALQQSHASLATSETEIGSIISAASCSRMSRMICARRWRRCMVIWIRCC